MEHINRHRKCAVYETAAELKFRQKHDSGDANKQIVYVFIVKIMKYSIYMSLSYNSHDFQNKADFGSGDFQYTCPRASCEQSACAWPVVSIGIGIGSRT
jgi:hypothetical protein